jgi:flavin reductase (DIM6/NTAB) family NADH-FMN oxidoreductase RutF
MDPAVTYTLLRSLTSPIVAVTSRRGEKRNGMISDGAIRASIVPDVPRLGVFIHKFNLSHDLVFEAGAFGMHVLHTGQLDLVHRLGWFSGRDRDKLADVPHRLGQSGVPVLEDCWCWFECAVCNVMDTGSSTFFMGDVVASGRGPGTDVLEPDYLRDHLPAQLQRDYASRLARAQDEARALARTMKPVVWRGLPPA